VTKDDKIVIPTSLQRKATEWYNTHLLHPREMLLELSTTERELLSIVKTLKEYQNILLGQEIEVFTNHKNLVYKTFNTEHVMRWRLIIEEFGPKLTYIKGASNIVADALSGMRLTETDFGPEVLLQTLKQEISQQISLCPTSS
jgi:RNase H-like domain found in reverse transcriptase